MKHWWGFIEMSAPAVAENNTGKERSHDGFGVAIAFDQTDGAFIEGGNEGCVIVQHFEFAIGARNFDRLDFTFENTGVGC